MDKKAWKRATYFVRVHAHRSTVNNYTQSGKRPRNQDPMKASIAMWGPRCQASPVGRWGAPAGRLADPVARPGNELPSGGRPMGDVAGVDRTGDWQIWKGADEPEEMARCRFASRCATYHRTQSHATRNRPRRTHSGLRSQFRARFCRWSVAVPRSWKGLVK